MMMIIRSPTACASVVSQDYPKSHFYEKNGLKFADKPNTLHLPYFLWKSLVPHPIKLPPAR